MVIQGEAKVHFVAALREIAAKLEQPEEALAVLTKIATPPLTVAVISSPVDAKIPCGSSRCRPARCA